VAQSILRPWLELARISNLPTVWTNILGAWLLVGGKWDWQPLAWLLIGGSLLYTGGMILNDAADLKFDQEHRKERPIPSGRVSAMAAWSVGIGMMAVGFAMMVWGAQACIWLTSGLVAAILFYDLYHKPWVGSVFVMGSCRTLLYLAAASAVNGTLSFTENYEVIIKAIALGGYIVGLSLVARNEAAVMKPKKFWYGLGVLGLSLPFFGMLSPLVTSYYIWILLFGCALVPLFEMNHRNSRYLGNIATPFGLGFSVFIIRDLIAMIAHDDSYRTSGMVRWHTVLIFAFILVSYLSYPRQLISTPPPSNIGRAVGLLLAAIPLVDALAISSVAPVAALCFALSVPLLLLWQRKIAAT
jgi:4-hydroxybenzoate polyprenyltransferase